MHKERIARKKAFKSDSNAIICVAIFVIESYYFSAEDTRSIV